MMSTITPPLPGVEALVLDDAVGVEAAIVCAVAFSITPERVYTPSVWGFVWPGDTVSALALLLFVTVAALAGGLAFAAVTLTLTFGATTGARLFMRLTETDMYGAPCFRTRHCDSKMPINGRQSGSG